MTQTTDPGFLHRMRGELQPKRLLLGLTLGALLGFTEVIFALSVGSLIFSGDLAPFLSYGIGLSLVTATIMLVVISLGSSAPGVTGVLQFSPAVILAVIAAALVGASSPGGGEDRLVTVLVAIATTSLLTGVFFLALGYFKLGELVRFLPYPVVGGFLAGTGWLLVQGSFGVMADFPLTFSNLSPLFQSDQLFLWVPGLLFALLLFFAARRIKHFLVIPGILILTILVFYLALLVMGISVDEAIGRGLLLGGVSSGATWRPLLPESFLIANWAAILGQGGNIAIILVVSVVSLLLNASALELIFQQDIDLNRELRVAGFANILSGISGGAVGFHALNLSTLSYRIGARGRLPWLVAGLVCLILLFVGLPLVAFFPRPILGGLLLFMGFGFLVEWVIDGWSKLTHTDYAIVLLILVVIGGTDFLIGVGVGLVAMIILFVMKYSRINVVRHALSGAEMSSNVQRSTYHQRVLRELGQGVYILELQGFIFFGTGNVVLERIRARLSDDTGPEVRFVVLDFRRVNGLDTSAAMSFIKAKQLTEALGITLLLTNVTEEIQRQFEVSGLSEDEGGLRVFTDLDHGLEWCENQLLEIGMVTMMIMPTTLRAQLTSGGFSKDDTARLTEFLEKTQFEQGEHLIRQGEQADDLFFIEFGEGVAYLELEGGARVRLRTIDPGTVVGEMALYLGTTRIESVIANTRIIAYRLTQEALSTMRESEPELAATFHEYIVRLLSERLINTTRVLEAVLK